MASNQLHENQGLMATSQTHEDPNHEVERKPSLPTLRESAPSWFWRVGMPAMLIAIPLAYVLLIGAVAYLRNKNQSQFGDGVLEILQIASTLWPISFAAVMGPFLKTLALYRAEKGSALGSLEFLLTTQTMAEAFKNLIILRSFQFWALGIAMIWCLSPLGGQAAVRSLYLHPHSRSMKTDAIYYPGSNISDLNRFLNTSGDVGVLSGNSAQKSLMLDMRSLVIASFSTPDILISHANSSTDDFDDVVRNLGGRRQAVRLGQRDLWKNVRIPFMELLPNYKTKDPTAWLSVPTDSVVPYASLLGIPIRGGSFNRTGNSTMVVKSRYQTLSCGPDFNATEWLKPDATQLLLHNTSAEYLPEQYEQVSPNGGHPNIILDVLNNTETIMGHRLLLRQFPDTDVEPSSKLQLLVGGECDGSRWETTTFLRKCDVSTSYVDIEVTCVRPDPIDELLCQADRVRHTPKFPISGNLTALSSMNAMNGVLWEIPFTTASYHIGEASMLEAYLKNPSRMFTRLEDSTNETSGPACFVDVPQQAFEARLAMALNTFIMATYKPSVLTGGDGTSLRDRDGMWKSSTATWTEFADSIYVLDRAWLSISVLSTLVLFSCSVVNVVIRSLIKAPDFFDSVAGLTRDSPYIDVPQVGSAMSGSDRLQMIKNIRVRICDVQPDSESGRVALTTGVDNRKLDWGRRYC
ncbi:hypothetical protein FALBO_6496 [Fusarium albosuccineum]|uniref:Uncharacterized protein n=1 Tax=Fusarium albosuccineum TaxID=1237068 RepID=A0A8H4LFM7_9HYPO|nr:hypothetical protein FALBO_6496 [Fusarium albosuccineum]